jgi:HPt (histidine-containing phosphotransfer) domain-containing protein
MMQVRILSFLLFLLSLLSAVPAMAADYPEGCTSCRIVINSLDKPVKLSGQWLFTRDDLPTNKDVGIDTSNWRLAKAPGPWKGIYEDTKVFPVGWYRANFEFNPALEGQEAVLLLNAYMGRVQVYVDGVEVYSRPKNINVERYYSVQAIPIRFKISQNQTLAVRVDTPLMAGIYQLPLELHKYDKNDSTLVGYQFLGGEMRLIVAYVVPFFGLFFLLVYSKTRYALYLMCAATCISFYPFFAAPGDSLLGIFQPEKLLYLHYTGLFGFFFVFLFTQYFYKFTPVLNWIVGIAFGAMALVIASMMFYPNIELFQKVRSVYFIVSLALGLAGTYMTIRGTINKTPGAAVLMVGMLLFLVFGVNDMLLALGKISSFSMIFFGVMACTASILYVASTMFANTFVDNKRLVRDLKAMNDGLEELVTERTAQLRQKTNDIQSMMQNMPQGVLTVLDNSKIHPEYSAYLQVIFETSDIAGRDVMDLVFTNTNLGSNALSQVEAAVDACIGQDSMNFEFNAHLMVTEFEKKMPDGRVKAIELSWSPICDENDLVEKIMLCARDVTELKRLGAEANAQRRELEIIGEILSVSQEKFQEFIDTAYNFVQENYEITTKTKTKDEEAISILFRNMHTIKGNARTHGLMHMTNVVHETEQSYDWLRKDPEAVWDPQQQADQLAQVKALVDEYSRVNSTTLGRKGPGRRGNVERFLMVDKEQLAQTMDVVKSADQNDVSSLRAALSKISSTLNTIGTSRIDKTLSGVVESLPSLAQELGKEPPVVTIEDHGILVRNQMTGLLKNLFVHLLRNSIDHGIEDAPTRVAAGKSPIGHIQLSLSLNDETLELRLKDDGRGLNIGRIRQIATERNLIAPNASMPSLEVAQLIFASGFSTAEKVTEVSGRGVGMDAVKGFLQKEDGDVQIHFLNDDETSEFRPFELVIYLPGKFGVQA